MFCLQGLRRRLEQPLVQEELFDPLAVARYDGADLSDEVPGHVTLLGLATGESPRFLPRQVFSGLSRPCLSPPSFRECAL